MPVRPCRRSSVVGATLLAVLGLLGGCDDPALERGVPPPILLDQARIEVPLRSPYRATRLLRRELDALAPGGLVRQVDASIRTTNLSRRDATRAVLVQMGLDPDRIAWSARPDETVVLTRATAIVTPCGAGLRSDWQGDVGNSLTSLGTCVQANNLAEMVSDPRDLAKPVALGPTDGAVAAKAVQDWEDSGVREPPRHAEGDEAQPGAASSPAASATGASLNPLLTPSLSPGLPGG